MIPVTKPHLPDRTRLDAYVDGIYERGWITNNGPLVRELTQRLESWLGVDNMLLVSNGTLALQIAYRALGITGKAITTPFSFVATTSSLKWEGIEPVFADIDAGSYCLDPVKVEQTICEDTQALIPVHVFGNGCDVEALDAIAQKNDLKIVYDGAHAFGVNYKNQSLLQHGDATTLSFHATKLFHSIEGGAIVFKHKEDLERAKRYINFGIDGPESIVALGINAKMNEFQAAMGLCLLDEIDTIMAQREAVAQQYREQLVGHVQLQTWNSACSRNHAYFPVVFASEEQLLHVQAALNDSGISPRRYFYPSLDTLDYMHGQGEQPVSRDIARRILCLPIYAGLQSEHINTITSTIIEACKASIL